MPNWTHINIRSADGSDIFNEKTIKYFEEAYCRKIKDNINIGNLKTEIDFNNFVPQPKLLINRSLGSQTSKVINYYYQTHNLSEEELKELLNPEDECKDNIFDKALEEYKNAGYPKVDEIIPNWYDWNNNNWGTKWNAYYSEIYFDEIIFNTAWNMPSLKLMNRLLKAIRDLMMKSFPEYKDEEESYLLSIEIEYEGEPYTYYQYTFGEDEELTFYNKRYEPIEDEDEEDDEDIDDDSDF